MAQYRAKGPDGRMYKFEGPEGLSNKDASFFLGQYLNLGVGEEEPAPVAPIAPPPQTGFIPSVKRGFMQTGMLMGDILPAMAARAVGADEYAERQLKEAAATQKEIQEKYPAAVPSFTDIKGAGDAVKYITEAVGEAIPSILPGLFTGGAASIAGRGAVIAAKEAAEKAALSSMAEGLAAQEIKDIATKAGIQAARRTALKYEATGALAGSAAQNIPEVYQNILEETGKEDLGAALVGGSFNAVLDAILPIQLLRKAKVSGIPENEIIGAWYKRGAAGLGKGFLTEGATEAVQEMSSTAAVKFVDDNKDFFTKENFIKFIDAGLKGGIGGGAITGATNVVFGRAAPEQAGEQPPAITPGSILDQGAETDDVTEPFELTGGKGAGVAGVAGTKPPTGRPVTTKPSRVVSPTEDAGQPPTGAGAQPASIERFEDFSRQYNDLRQEANELLSITSPTEATGRKLTRVNKDLAEIVDANADLIGDKALISQLKNPMFDGTQIVSQLASGVGRARGMAGDLFGGRKDVLDLTNRAIAIGQGNPEKSVQYLQDELQRRERTVSGQANNGVWGRSNAALVGMSPQEGFFDPATVAKKLLAKYRQDTEIAIAAVRSGGQARGVQGDLFGAPIPGGAPSPRSQLLGEFQAAAEEVQREGKAAEPEFGADEGIVEEPAVAVTEEQPVEVKKERVLAPTEDTERMLETEEGRAITSFFDAIEPASDSPVEREKYQSPKNVAQEALLRYDIAAPGETTTAGGQTALRYLANRVGGMEAFQQLLQQLQGASPDRQAFLLQRAGLPNLTSRRGMEEFSAQVQSYLDQLPAKGEGIPTPQRSVPSPVTRTVVPYKEEIEQDVRATQESKQPKEGRPRRPGQVSKIKQYTISDTKWRSALRMLRQAVSSGEKLSATMRAAANYLNNRNRGSFGDALRDLAFDLAMFELDPKHYGANSTFYGEGGRYAQDFRAWIEQNLDPNTVTLLDELIADHKATAQANAQFEQALSQYTKALDAYTEKRRLQASADSKITIPKAPKKSREPIVSETALEEREEIPEPKISRKNLPRIQGLYEIHPAIRRALETGDTRRALEIIADTKSNPYYATLAERLLEAGITAKVQLIPRDTIAPLNDTPANRETFVNSIAALREFVTTTLPEDSLDFGPNRSRRAEFIRLLDSNKLRDLERVIQELNALNQDSSISMTDAQVQLIATTTDFFNQQYGWVGKYDPATDTIYMRQEVGMTNHTFMHEAVHAVAIGLIDDPDTLSGLRREGYNQLSELFKYAENILAQDGLSSGNTYGLTDLHEFLSEALTNPEFQAKLRAIRYKASPLSLMSRFVESICKLFNIKKGRESNVLNEVIFAADAMLLGGTAGKETMTGPMQARGMAGKAAKSRIPVGRPNSKTSLRNYMTPRKWDEVRAEWPMFYSGLAAQYRPLALGGLTLRQIADLVNKRIPQIDNFINVVENYMSRKNRILQESGDISKRWQRLQARDPEMSRKIGEVMHRATIQRIDPDKATAQQRNTDPDLMTMWRGLSPEAQQIYRDVRNFYERRFNEYKRTLRARVVQMRQLGVSETTINEIRNEFEKGVGAGPYFPLMRYGRFWYQVGKGGSREYYMFESFSELQAHLRERLARDPYLEGTLIQGDQYMRGMDLHARESSFLKSAFKAVDEANTTNPNVAQTLKDELYQAWLVNQPESSFRNRFVHRQAIEGFSQDALRNFASSSFHMAYQQARFEYSPDMFSQITAARMQLRDRVDESDRANPEIMRENNELSDYVRELELRLQNIMNPQDTGLAVSVLSNIGFLWYLTSFASAATNIFGGLVIGLPTLIGQQIRDNPGMSYTTATLKSLGQMKTVAAQILGTGFNLERGPRIRDNMVLFPSLDRAGLNRLDQAAYNRFVADGLIDITSTYDQSGLAATPTESYDGIRHRAMVALSALFHNAERFNREVIAMSAFRSAMSKRAGYPDQQRAFAEAIAEAKDTTHRSMFDYSAANKPRYMQHPAARVILQFKQFPQQMTFYLVRNLQQMLKGASPEVRREATARFVGTMGMTAALAGTTGVWGFSTLAAIVNAVMNGFGDGDEEEPFDFELEYVNWAVNTFGTNFGMFLTRGAGNAGRVDLHSRLSLDNMWFREGRKNLDEEEAWRQFLVDLLGPTVGLTVSAARAVDLYNQGHADRALEAIAPGFIKQPLIAARYEREGVQTLRGDKLVEDVGPFDLLMQSLGFRPAEIAEIQYYNITKKGQEQDILKKRQNLLNLYGLAFIANDADAFDKSMEKIMEYNDKYPSVGIQADTLNRSVKQRLEKSAQAEHGLIIDKRLMQLLDEEYVRKLT